MYWVCTQYCYTGRCCCSQPQQNHSKATTPTMLVCPNALLLGRLVYGISALLPQDFLAILGGVSVRGRASDSSKKHHHALPRPIDCFLCMRVGIVKLVLCTSSIGKHVDYLVQYSYVPCTITNPYPVMRRTSGSGCLNI